jgi:hypothetical protein
MGPFSPCPFPTFHAPEMHEDNRLAILNLGFLVLLYEPTSAMWAFFFRHHTYAHGQNHISDEIE